MFLADGFEETEALVTLDLMRRAGIDVKTVGIGKKIIVGAHSISIVSDLEDNEVCASTCDGIVLPGGMPGTENLYNSKTASDMVEYCFVNKKLICAICAAPIILGRKGMLRNVKSVCFPGFENELSGAIIMNTPCVNDGNVITAKGAGCVFEFSHEIISYICDTKKADEIIEIIQHDKLLK